MDPAIVERDYKSLERFRELCRTLVRYVNDVSQDPAACLAFETRFKKVKKELYKYNKEEILEKLGIEYETLESEIVLRRILAVKIMYEEINS